ncbi:MAG TPA: cellulose biosynthesis cyclic di-GMP-binding regulatory protein BcsB [Leptolyngbyaceae cyanobacterium M65_K2018_010]|nr:cellulose biosynthesis cyclic di-GMP-binding regulatory protein BcsB [Leptolyngbyaceae cyanobacterium M65_K2018_010]
MRNRLIQRFWGQRRQWRGLARLTTALGCAALVILVGLDSSPAQTGGTVKKQEDAVIQQYSLPRSNPPAPVVKPAPQRSSAPPASQTPSRPSAPGPSPQRNPVSPPSPVPSPGGNSEPAPQPELRPAAETAPLSQYVLQFNRSPVVGNALQLQGVLSQARLGFTRPRHWQVESAKVQLRFRHSPALYADRSNLTVRLNNRHLGSVPLNREAESIGNVLFDIPADLVQDFNTLIVEAQQHTSKDCTDPTDPTLWTEILPDSQVILNYRPQAIALDFTNYPYPFLDALGLEPDRLAYLQPNTVDTLWLTAASRYQAAASRASSGRGIQTRLVKQLDQVKAGDRLVLIGTPTAQPALATLGLPLAIKNNQVLDGDGKPLPPGVGVLMLTTTANDGVPVLVATGNDAAAVLKAVQALVQPADQQLLTGQVALVNQVSEAPSPNPMAWPGFLPQGSQRLRLSDLEIAPNQLFQDVTVNGLPVPPPVEIPFRLLPDAQLLGGSSLTLRYSYGPGIDPKRSSVSILLDGQGIGGERLTSAQGGTDSVTVSLPPELVTPSSTLAIQFYTFPNVPINCGALPDQPMWAKVHGNSSLQLNQGTIVQLPDLKRLQTGFPLTAPQDLSQLALVLPNTPSEGEIGTMLAVSDRMGRLSHGSSVKLAAYTADDVPSEARQKNLVGLGLRDNFPIPELFQSSEGFNLMAQFGRQQGQTQLQTLPDQAGVVQARVSPWQPERMLLGLTAQTQDGLKEVQQVFWQDPLFARLEGDTVLVQRTTANPSLYDPADYRLTTLTQYPQRTLDRRSPQARIIAFLQRNWFLLPGGIVLIALLLYGLSQLYLNRLSRPEGI